MIPPVARVSEAVLDQVFRRRVAPADCAVVSRSPCSAFIVPWSPVQLSELRSGRSAGPHFCAGRAMPDVIDSALHGIGALVSVQLASRAVTFLLNVAVARLSDVRSFGTTVSLQLFVDVALWWLKEGIRRAAVRDISEASPEERQRSAFNIAAGGAAGSAVYALGLSFFWVMKPPEGVGESYTHSCAVVFLACAVEAAAEPWVVPALLELQLASRAAAEGKALLLRTLAFAGLRLAMGDLLLAFAYAQLVYALAWAWHFYRAASPAREGSALAARLDGGGWLAAGHSTLLLSFAGICVQKLLVTHGEKIVLVWLFDTEAWGVFGLVSNLGSIILRLLFAPMEEIAFTSFSQKSGAADAGGDDAESDSALLLRSLMFVQASVGWLGVCFGFPAAGPAVHALYGEHWMDAGMPLVLRIYCILLLLFAVNGILEAYVYGRASSRWLFASQGASAVASVLMLATAFGAQSLGPVALVAANAIGTSVRVLFSASFVAAEHNVGAFGVLGVLFPRAAWRVFLAGAVGGFLSAAAHAALAALMPHSGRRSWLQLIASGALGLAVLLALRRDIRAVVTELRSRKKRE